ncbi:MAG: GC-type dockerin domain-anchored protein [Phycisphaerales bacterium JB064]
MFGIVIGALPRLAGAQPADKGWLDAQFAFPGLNGTVYDMVTWDDGTGEAMYVAGAFTIAGTDVVGSIARWDGSEWSSLGEGIDQIVNALVVYDDGSGEALYAAGRFAMAGGEPADDVARWDGTAWSPVGNGTTGTVAAMAVFDDGFGPALFIGGSFTTAGGGIARLDGSVWAPLGDGLSGTGLGVASMAVFDDGTGEALYAGGRMSFAEGQQATNLARWDGAHWSPVETPTGEGVDGVVNVLEVLDTGAGPELYVGGWFSQAGGVAAESIARWNSGTWSPLGTGIDRNVRAIALLDGGNGPTLCVGGQFFEAGGQPVFSLAQWDGTAWLPMGNGVGSDLATQVVESLHVFDAGDGPRLYAGGSFTITNGAAGSRLIRWDGSAWQSLEAGLSGPVHATLAVDEPGGKVLYVGGEFLAVEPGLDEYPRNLARWDGQHWSDLDGQFNGPVYALAMHDAGDGPQLYAGGTFTMIDDVPANNIARWDGDQWHALGAGVSDAFPETQVRAMISHDDGTGHALYVGGKFQQVGELGFTELIARWDGTQWSRLGPDLTLEGATVFDLEVFDEGDGPLLFACGDFEGFESVSARRIGRWDGTQWSQVGERIQFSARRISALEVYDDGTGPALYAGGDMRTFGDVTVNRIARWDGTAWSALGDGVDAEVFTLESFDDGSGPQLYASGDFDQAGAVAAELIARWDGSAWHAMGSGLPFVANAMSVFDAGSGDTLIMGGAFTAVEGFVSNRLAVWAGPPPPPCPADLDGDGELTIFDFLRYQNLFDAGNLLADFDEDGELTIFDFLAFQNAFDAGCA